MKPVDIYNSFDRSRAARIARNGRLLFKLGKNANPATACIDAVISVGDAICSFYQYKTAVEQTSQLLSELRNMKLELDLLKNKLKVFEQNRSQELKYEIDINKQKLRKQQVNLDMHKNVYEGSRKWLLFCKENIERIKREFPGSASINELESQYYSALNNYTEAALLFIGG